MIRICNDPLLFNFYLIMGFCGFTRTTALKAAYGGRHLYRFQIIKEQQPGTTCSPVACLNRSHGTVFRNGAAAHTQNTPHGDDRDRTGNLRRARAALSQLSYIPSGSDRQAARLRWAYVDSNHGPQLYQSCALTN